MPSNSSFRDLDLWQESMRLVEDVYRITRRFPADERFGLRSQIRKAAVSVPSNIGEIDHQKIAVRVDRIGRMLNGLIESLQPVDDAWC
jgi:23S rRNA-intervening sequence protein